jgi:hypothetical protein
MSKIQKIVLAVIAIVIIGGLAGEDTDTSSRGTTPRNRQETQPLVAQEVDPDEEELNELAFVMTIRSEIQWARVADDEELIDLGRQACVTLRDLQPKDQDEYLNAMALTVYGSDVDPGEFGFLFGAAVPAFCPEFEYLF